MKYNRYFADHFGSCTVLLVGRDEHRQRDVRVFAIPGEFEVVGLSDGTDAWVAPVNAIGSALLAQAKARLELMKEGKTLPAFSVRRKLLVDPEVSTPAPEAPQEPKTNRRTHLVLTDF